MKLSDIYMRDPYVYVEDGVCYLIGTSDVQAWGGKASGFLGYKSTNLEDFEGPYLLFERDPSFWADENFWAPELHKINGKYFIFASFYKEGRRRASQVLMSSSPFGRYIPSKKPFTPEGWDCLDATHYEEKGKHYAVFCHEWVQCGDGEICLGELNEDFTSLNNVEVLFRGSEAPWAVPHDENKGVVGYVTDGPFLFKDDEGRLCMIWSSFSKDGYSLGVAISQGGVRGPWKQEEKPLLSNGGGHGMVFSFKGKRCLIVHINNDDHPHERPFIAELKEKGGRFAVE